MEKLYELKEFLLEKKYYMIGGMIFLILLSIAICFSYNKLTKETKKEVILFEEEKKEEIIKEDCYANVDIKGEVLNPGLYKVICDSRVQDVIDASGGLTKNGDTTLLNLGKKVIDEMVIIVYSKKEIENATNQNEIPKEEIKLNNTTIKSDAYIKNEDILNEDNVIITDTPVNSLVSINKATKEELMTLTGIGESKAKSIISYRNENGNFKSIEEIKNIKGIGDSIFEKIKNSITL